MASTDERDEERVKAGLVAAVECFISNLAPITHDVLQMMADDYGRTLPQLALDVWGDKIEQYIREMGAAAPEKPPLVYKDGVAITEDGTVHFERTTRIGGKW